MSHRHVCRGADPADAARLAELLSRSDWFALVLSAVAASGLPDAWVGAGVIRSLVWGGLYGEDFAPGEMRDIDVPYFDAGDLSRERDTQAEAVLTVLADLPWEATNQAAVHTWYHEVFGGSPAEPFLSVHDAIATWPETATCVAVRGRQDDLEVCAPHGLTDLLGGVWRVNPVRVTPQVSRSRLERQRVAHRWPGVRIVPP